MSDDPYGDILPTEAGWYWLRSERGTEIIARRTRDGEWELDGPELWDEWSVADNYQFGPRVPTPEELADLRRDAERFRTCERLAEYWPVDGGFWAVRANSGDTFTAAVDAARKEE